MADDRTNAELAEMQEEELAVETETIRRHAEEDLEEVIKYLKTTTRRRAATEWSVPR